MDRYDNPYETARRTCAPWFAGPSWRTTATAHCRPRDRHPVRESQPL